MKKIAIIIPCINLWYQYLKPCLESIKTKHEYSICVVDNGSDEDYRDTEYDKEFDVIRFDENMGCSAAWNAGVRKYYELGYEYFLILNNDVLLHPRAIDALIERFEKGDEDVVMVTMFDMRGELPLPAQIFLQADNAKDNVEEAESPCFSGFMMNRKCWEDVGEFDEKFFPAYFEDNDYHYRIKLAGLKAIMYPPAMFYHYGSKTQTESGSEYVVKSPQFENNRSYYIRKWGGPPGEEKYTMPFNRQEFKLPSAFVGSVEEKQKDGE